MATATPEPIAAQETVAASPPAPPEGSGGSLFRITLDTYRRMGEAGLITREDRVVLLDGLLVKKMTKGPRHCVAKNEIRDRLAALLSDRYYIWTEDPVELPGGPEGDSAPEPDIMIIRGKNKDYRDRLPVAADVLLVVEVADSSLADDRRGLRRYAWAGIPTAWIVNLRAGTVEAYTDPSGPGADPGYATKVTRPIGADLDLALDGRRVEGIAVAGFFP